MDFPRRGEIYLVNFDLFIGHETKKLRPALIISIKREKSGKKRRQSLMMPRPHLETNGNNVLNLSILL